MCTQGATTSVVAKAPEALRPLLEGVPGGLRRVVRAARVEGHEGARFSFSDRIKSNRLDRSTAETDLIFRGFLCLTSPLKPVPETSSSTYKRPATSALLLRETTSSRRRTSRVPWAF